MQIREFLAARAKAANAAPAADPTQSGPQVPGGVAVVLKARFGDIDAVERLPKLKNKPNTAGMSEIELADHRPVDGPQIVAFADLTNRTVYVRCSGTFMMGSGNYEDWYGPSTF